MDLADFAAETEAGILERALAAHAARAHAAGLGDQPSALLCADCGDPIPEARRAAVRGCERCAECADFAERRELIRKRTGR